MPPHCDTRDGPVVQACQRALREENINLILPWLPQQAESEMKDVFQQVQKARKLGKEAENAADTWLYETAVRLHRAGEGAPYTGLKPAGLDEGPVVHAAEEALKTGNAKEVMHLLTHALEHSIGERFKRAMAKQKFDENNIPAAREYVHAMLDFMLFSHHLYETMMHGTKEDHKHEA